MIWLIGAGLALIVAVVVTMVALWPSGDEPSSAAPATDWPAAKPRPTGAPAPAPVASASASVSPPASRSSAPAPTTTAPAASGEGGGPRPSVTVPGTVPPPVDRTGAIAGGGACLDVVVGGVLLGNGLAARGCDGTSSQQWTVAADGTLRSMDLCARSEGDGVVRLQDCDKGGAIQWRTGTGGSLVNADAGQCLTRTGGSGVRLAACDAQGQDWKLP